MAPDSTIRFCHDENIQANNSVTRPSSLKTTHRVRTEYVIKNICNYLLLKNGFDQVTEITSVSSAERQVTNALKKVVTDFKKSYSDRVSDLCSQLEVTVENVNSVFVGVLNELFAEGITWSRLATLCVFASELATQCLQKGHPDVIVDQILGCCIRYIENNMENWINDHGGWEGIIDFARGGNPPPKSISPGWAKSVLHGTVRVFGTLAQLATTTSGTLFPMQSY